MIEGPVIIYIGQSDARKRLDIEHLDKTDTNELNKNRRQKMKKEFDGL